MSSGPDADHSRAPTVFLTAAHCTAGLLDQLKAAHELDDQTFTAVGYGTVREDETGGPHSLFLDGVRRYALQHAAAIWRRPGCCR